MSERERARHLQLKNAVVGEIDAEELGNEVQIERRILPFALITGAAGAISGQVQIQFRDRKSK